jgi:hypothetical protein
MRSTNIINPLPTTKSTSTSTSDVSKATPFDNTEDDAKQQHHVNRNRRLYTVRNSKNR